LVTINGLCVDCSDVFDKISNGAENSFKIHLCGIDLTAYSNGCIETTTEKSLWRKS